MFVSIRNFKAACIMYPKEAQIFIHFFMTWYKAKKRKASYLAGEKTFSFYAAEESASWGPDWPLYKYRQATELAANKLFKLDKVFFKSEHLHFVKRLETFSDMETALEEIEQLLDA